jgi:hypothetical protein
MRMHHITTETFRLPGDDPTLPDCYIDPKELAAVRRLTVDTLGIMEKAINTDASGSGESLPTDIQKTVDDMRKLAGINKDHGGNDSGAESPLSAAGTVKGEYMRKNDIAPGTDAWFKLWFARPGLTGENPMPKGAPKVDVGK